MEDYSFFPYSWYIDTEETEVTVIRAYGLDDNNENVCVQISDFKPYVYLELPNDIKWDETLAQRVKNAINDLMVNKTSGEDHRPIEMDLKRRRKLYYAHIDVKTNKYKKFHFLYMTFSSLKDIDELRMKLRGGLYVQGLNKCQYTIHESNADPILQLCCNRNIPTSGWIKFKGRRVKNKKTLCDHEFNVSWLTLEAEVKNKVPNPLIMSFDIEVNSSKERR
jgi:DNA polymerase elongation subunit (family B)